MYLFGFFPYVEVPLEILEGNPIVQFVFILELLEAFLFPKPFLI